MEGGWGWGRSGLPSMGSLDRRGPRTYTVVPNLCAKSTASTVGKQAKRCDRWVCDPRMCERGVGAS